MRLAFRALSMHRSLCAAFHIEQLLGRGATAEVFAALTRDGRRVALKVGRSSPGLLAGVRRCFEREVDAAERVKSAHVCAAVDWQLSSCDSPFIAFERVAGKNLVERFRRGPLPLGAVADLGCQLLRALSDVHEVGLVHCDVKPSNILLAEQPKKAPALVLIDFGISRDTTQAEPAKTRWALGTPAYMSPEQILGGSLDAATDVYSASVVLYMALTGKRPFAWSPDSKKVLRRVLEAPVQPPSAIRSDCPPELEAVVLQGLARRPSERFSTAAAMRTALSLAARRCGLRRGAAAWQQAEVELPAEQRAA
jgi:serine/threonine-protein kinase